MVEDIVQDAFVHLWKNRKKLEAPSNWKSYVFQVAKNKMLEHLRKQKTYEEHLMRIRPENDLSAEEDQMAERLVKLEQINSSLRHLPPKCREVFIMHKYKGLTYAEIAEDMGLSQKTIENHMLKAIKMLREILAK